MAVVHENHVHLAKTDHQFDAPVLLCTNRFEALLISPNGKWLAGWVENQIEVWALDKLVAKPKLARKITGSQHFAFSPNGKYLVTCWARACHFWEVGTWAQQDVPQLRAGPSDPHSPLAFAPSAVNGRTILAVADSFSTVKLFHMTDGPSVTLLEIARLESPDRSSLVALAFNRDGSRLAAATTDQTVQVWDLAKLREGLLEMGLAGDFPTFPDRSVGTLSVEFEADVLRDTETPRKWQEVEKLTTMLSTTTKPESGTISTTRFQRGKLFMVLGRRELAKADLAEALRLTPNDAGVRDAVAALERDPTASP
jgi:WD40 repeat protein